MLPVAQVKVGDTKPTRYQAALVVLLPVGSSTRTFVRCCADNLHLTARAGVCRLDLCRPQYDGVAGKATVQ
jgi:hypothetical protein